MGYDNKVRMDISVYSDGRTVTEMLLDKYGEGGIAVSDCIDPAPDRFFCADPVYVLGSDPYCNGGPEG